MNKKFIEYKKLNKGLSDEQIREIINIEEAIHAEVEKNIDQWTQDWKQEQEPSFKTKPKKKKVKKPKEKFRTPRACFTTFDHLGQCYANREQMCKAWNIDIQLFHSRYQKGWSVERILTTPVRPRRTTKQKILDDFQKLRNKKNEKSI